MVRLTKEVIGVPYRTTSAWYRRTGPSVRLVALVAGLALLSACASEGPRAPGEGVLSDADAAAAESDVFSRAGRYLILSHARAFEDFSDTGPFGYDDSSAFVIRAGKRLSSRVAVELELARLDEFSDGVSVPGGSASAEFDAWSLLLNVKYFPFTGRFQPYGVLGAGAIAGTSRIHGNGRLRSESTRSTDNEFLFKAGVGLDAYLDPNWAVNVEYAHHWPSGNITDGWWSSRGDLDDFEYDLVSIGLMYRF